MNIKNKNYKQYVNKQYVGEKYTFEITDEDACIGKGGNGIVFCASCKNLSGNFVIKILKIQDSKRLKRFEREIIAMKNINNRWPNKVCLKIVDYNLNNGTKWYAMYKEIPLPKYIADNKLEFYDRCKLCLKLCETLTRLHEFGYCHRDIKPDNLFYRDKVVLLGDFGLEWHEFNCEHYTDIGEAIGPQNIKPPECYPGHARDIPNELQSKIDVYEFAKTMWLILKGEKYCFPESYLCRRKDIQLSFNDIEISNSELIKTLEPLHELLEKATEFEATKRPEMKECYGMLENFFIINNNEKESDKLNLKRSMKEFFYDNQPEMREYYSVETIYNFLILVKKCMYISIDNSQYIKLKNIRIINSKEAVLEIKDYHNNNYLCKVQKLCIYKDDISNRQSVLIVIDDEFKNYTDYKSYFSELDIPGIIIENRNFYINKNCALHFKSI